METINEIFAANLRRLRGKLSQAQAAENAKMPFRTYQSHESGAIPQRPGLLALSRAFKVPEWELFRHPSTLPLSPRDQLLRMMSSLDDTKAEFLLSRVKEFLATLDTDGPLLDAEKNGREAHERRRRLRNK